ncbi:PREDICTED: LEAF RUST 10 DISEASE-RESISTANCE LOCUS RECEPTOR-LIKE PROTEIN KINASE-like 1.1 [Ipomoea nil]|uniref:LEAF RUST 10 DISEASE-RESISTANCE LOCUS RECEPTOR-LIKE PROTEIN KINASE-like 1.1 n=1 Tax=Ipomoea nil TaxID=35883 RepID=UPI0009013C43|nr:PREDICTED: LEAF RUST 10 DISEASE-RESISTANCE LOCUS RECEPTOR-LIKE PROTEIN KINASE-like 1.1 [Ipomoea nil]
MFCSPASSLILPSIVRQGESSAPMAQPFIPRLFFLLPLIMAFYFAHGEEDESPLSNCPKRFTCGNIDYLHFPFTPHTHPHCGLVVVNCYTTPPTVQLETDGEWYQLQNVKPKTIFLEDSKLQRLFHRHDGSILNYTVPFQNSPSITFRYSKSNTTFLQCNNNGSVDEGSICNYERHSSNCIEGLSLYYKRPENYGRCRSVPASCALLPTPIIINKTNGLVTAQFGIDFEVSEACYECYYGGGRCTVDIHNQFQCQKGKSTMRTKMLKVILVTVLSRTTLILTFMFVLLLCITKKLFICPCKGETTKVKNYQDVPEFSKRAIAPYP